MARRDSSLAIDPVPDGYMLVWVVDGETGAVVGEMPDASFPDPGECPSYDAFREDWEFAETQRVAALTGEYSGDDAYRRGLVWRSRKGVREALKAIQEAWKAVPSEKSYLAARKSALEAKASEELEDEARLRELEGHTYTRGIGSTWRVVDLIRQAEALPVERRPLSFFEGVMRRDPCLVWEYSDMGGLVEHMKRVLAADTRYPVLVDGATGELVDGYHRLLHAHLKGLDELPVKVFPRMPPPMEE